MTTRMTRLALVVAAALIVGPDLLACGDKFLVVSRGTRFQRAAALRNASILVFANPASRLAKGFANVSIDDVLRKAGYKPTTVTTAAELKDALGRGGWDLMLVDVADGAAIGAIAQGDAGPAVLPVVYNPTSAELAQAKQSYSHVLKSPAKSQTLIDAVDETLASRPQPKRRTAGKTGD